MPPAALAALGSAGAAVGSDVTKLTAPHLNPAFLQDMSQSGANMVSFSSLYVCTYCQPSVYTYISHVLKPC